MWWGVYGGVYVLICGFDGLFFDSVDTRQVHRAIHYSYVYVQICLRV